MIKYQILIAFTFVVVVLLICTLEAKTIGKSLYDEDDDLWDELKKIDGVTTTTTSTLSWADLNTFVQNSNKESFENNPNIGQTEADIKANDDLLKLLKANEDFHEKVPSTDSLMNSNSYNNYDYKTPEYTYYSSGVNGYHLSGGFFVIAIVLVFIRCCLICCRNQNRTRSIILVRETPVHAVIIQTRQRSNSKEDLMANAEPPADDPPSYEDCARNPVTNIDSDRPINSV